MSSLEREFSKLINTTYNYAGRPGTYGMYTTATTETESVIEVALCGMVREDVTIETEEGILAVATNSKNQSKLVRNFSQKFLLAADSDATAVSAKLENGLLTIRVPRVKPLKKVINIDVV